MKAATVHEIKQELSTLKPNVLAELCLRLAKFKKENKELLTYLLFEAADEQAYVIAVKDEINELFTEINMSHLYFAKKSLRKIVRIINKYSRYSNARETEIELRLYFCTSLKGSGIHFEQNNVISNLYNGQLKKIHSIVNTLHEDLQYEYVKVLNNLPSVSDKKTVFGFLKKKK